MYGDRLNRPSMNDIVSKLIPEEYNTEAGYTPFRRKKKRQEEYSTSAYCSEQEVYIINPTAELTSANWKRPKEDLPIDIPDMPSGWYYI